MDKNTANAGLMSERARRRGKEKKMGVNDMNEEVMSDFTIPSEGDTGAGEGGSGAPPAGKNRKSFFRASGSVTDIFVFAALLTFLMLMLGEIFPSVINNILNVQDLGMRLAGDEDVVQFLLQYFNFYGIWIAFILVITIFKGNWPMWKAFLYNRHGNNFKAVLAGILLGGGMNGFCILMSWFNGDIKLTYNSFDPRLFFLFLFCVFIQSGAEEMATRCYLYQKLRRRYRWPVIAVLVNALFFMALHMGNPGVTELGLLQVFLIGVLFSLIVFFWDSLWTVMWAHAAWNFSQSIVFGLPNSGIVSKYSVFKLDAASAVDGIFYNTSFGVEGSLGANIMIGAAILIVLIIGLAGRKGEKKDYWKEMEEKGGGKKTGFEIAILILLSIIAAAVFGILYWVSQHSDEIQAKLEEYQAQMPTDNISVSVLILPQYEVGELTGDTPGEAQYYYETYLEGAEEYDIDGDSEGCVLYVKDGTALYVTGTGKMNAALNTQALLSDPRFDFSNAYIIVTGSAASAAQYGVPGDVYVITSAVDYDLGHHVDSAEAGENGAAWVHDPKDDENALVNLDKDLTDQCYELVRKIKLQTTENTRAYMKEGYNNKKWARRKPQVLKGTAVSGESCTKGETVHAKALLMAEAYGCRDPYAALAPEDAAIGQVLRRMDLLDRFIILRTGIDTDLFINGETPETLMEDEGSEDAAGKLPGAADIYETAMKNNFEVGRVLIDSFLSGEEEAPQEEQAAQ